MTSPSSQDGFRPVSYGGRVIRGLKVRTQSNGVETYWGRLRIDGKDSRVKLDATTKTDAVREYENLRSDRNRDRAGGNPLLSPTVSECFDELLDQMQARVGISDEQRRRAQGTVDNYRHLADKRIRPMLGARRVSTITTGDLRRLTARMEAEGYAPVSVMATLRVVSVMLAFAAKSGYIDHNPYRDLGRDDIPGRQRLTEPRYLTEGEVTGLLACADDTYRPLFAALVYAALRVSEALGLLWRNIDFTNDEITVAQQLGLNGSLAPVKTKASAATVPLQPALRRELLAHRARQGAKGLQYIGPDAFVFLRTIGRRAGMPPRREAVQLAMRRFGDVAGLNPEGVPTVSPHDLRHTAAALAFEHGASVVEVCEFLRHANPNVTMAVYAGLTKDARGAAARKLREAGFGA